MGTAEIDFAPFERAIRRLYVYILAISAVGSAGGFFFLGWRGGLGFLAGAVASALNFRWLHRAVEAVGPSRGVPRKSFAVLLGLRYLLLGATVYVIVKVFGVNLLALLVGLAVPVAAVILEILYELTYGRA